MLSTIFNALKPDKLTKDQRRALEQAYMRRKCEQLKQQLKHTSDNENIDLEAVIERAETELRKMGKS